MQEKAPRRKMGFANIPASQQREIAALGGKMAHAKGTAHQFTSEEARAAGRKGAAARAAKLAAMQSPPESKL